MQDIFLEGAIAWVGPDFWLSERVRWHHGMLSGHLCDEATALGIAALDLRCVWLSVSRERSHRPAP